MCATRRDGVGRAALAFEPLRRGLLPVVPARARAVEVDVPVAAAPAGRAGAFAVAVHRSFFEASADGKGAAALT